MKTKILVSFIGLSLLISFNFVQAQEVELPSPGLTPDSPFYFLETIAEGIGTFFTFGDLKKAERYAALATERLAEAKAVAEKGKSELAEKTLERYKMQLNNSIARAEKVIAKGKSTEKAIEVLTRVSQATSKHLEVLAEVYEKVPEQAKSAIENAMKVSVKGREKAVEALKAQNALGEIPEEATMPMGVPQEVRERVQMRVQQELEIEKALEGIDSSKSLKDICAEKGGTPEMCDQWPLEKFKSFEQIEAFCTEKGGPLEICISLEAKCREFGVTTANECFLFLSISSITIYHSATMEIVPIPTLSEEEMEERRVQRETQDILEGEPGGGSIETEKRLKQHYTPGASKVIIYSTPNCPHCVLAIQWLQENSIEYEVFDISQNETKQNELMEKVGQLVVPIIEVEDGMLVGFNEESFSEFFGVE
ncbi:MAG: DUF5667 domain-containing protein [Candidatus Nealsonbacteria bacterium]